MRANWVTVGYDFTAPPDRVFAYLSEHENLAAVLGAQVEEDASRTGIRSATGWGRGAS